MLCSWARHYLHTDSLHLSVNGCDKFNDPRSMRISLIIVVIRNLSSCEILKPEKNSGLNGIRTHDLCDKLCITAMINHVVISFSAVQIYDHLYSLGYKENKQIDRHKIEGHVHKNNNKAEK